jgi:hypothetical protein
MIELFYVTTIVKQYHGCRDVPFVWFRNDPAEGRPYHELIRDYQPGDPYPESYIDELFTRDEANAVKAYLDREYGDAGTNTITQVDLPAPNNIIGRGAIPVGGGDDFYMLDKTEGYPLPFSVWGYFDLVGCRLIDGSDVYHHRLTLVFPDGTVRQQTNEEAAETARNLPRFAE